MLESFRVVGPNQNGFLEWGYILETGAVRAETNTSMVLFRTDASAYCESNIRWVPLDGIYEKVIVVSELGMNESIGEEDAVRVFKF